MSYYKFEWKGKEYNLKFNQLALEIMTSKASTSITSQNIYAMFYGGMRGNSYAKEEEPDYSFENVQDLVDEIYAEKRLEIIVDIEKALTETQLYKSLLPEIKDDKEKKSKQLRKVS